MSSHSEAPGKRRFVASLIRRAHNDPAFHKALRRNPRKTMEERLGHPLPKSLKVKVLQETEGTMYVVLPWHSPNGEGLVDDIYWAEFPPPKRK